MQVGIRTGHLHSKRYKHYVSRNLFYITVCLKLDEAMAVFAIKVFLCWLSLICFLSVGTREGWLRDRPATVRCKFPDHLAALCMLPVGCLCLLFKIHAIVISVFFFYFLRYQSPVIWHGRAGSDFYRQRAMTDLLFYPFLVCLFFVTMRQQF